MEGEGWGGVVDEDGELADIVGFIVVVAMLGAGLALSVSFDIAVRRHAMSLAPLSADGGGGDGGGVEDVEVDDEGSRDIRPARAAARELCTSFAFFIFFGCFFVPTLASLATSTLAASTTPFISTPSPAAKTERGTSSTQYARLRIPMSTLSMRSVLFRVFGRRDVARRSGRRSRRCVFVALLSRPVRKARLRISLALRGERRVRIEFVIFYVELSFFLSEVLNVYVLLFNCLCTEAVVLVKWVTWVCNVFLGLNVAYV